MRPTAFRDCWAGQRFELRDVGADIAARPRSRAALPSTRNTAYGYPAFRRCRGAAHLLTSGIAYERRVDDRRKRWSNWQGADVDHTIGHILQGLLIEDQVVTHAVPAEG